MISKSDHPALLLIDLQKGMDEHEYWGGNRNNPEAEQNAELLLRYWRDNHLPLFHFKHNSINPKSKLRLNYPGNDFKDEVRPIDGETVIEKSVNSAFIGTDLKQKLDAQGIRKVVIVGLTTGHCISTTTRMSGNLGYDTYLIADATATFDKVTQSGKRISSDMIQEVELASLDKEFATVMNAQELIQMLEG